MSLKGPRWQRHDRAVQEARTGPGSARCWLPGEIAGLGQHSLAPERTVTTLPTSPSLFPGETEVLSPSNGLGNRDTFLLTSGPPATAPQAEPGLAW